MEFTADVLKWPMIAGAGMVVVIVVVMIFKDELSLFIHAAKNKLNGLTNYKDAKFSSEDLRNEIFKAWERLEVTADKALSRAQVAKHGPGAMMAKLPADRIATRLLLDNLFDDSQQKTFEKLLQYKLDMSIPSGDYDASPSREHVTKYVDDCDKLIASLDPKQSS